MANAAAKAVQSELVDLWSRTDYVIDKIADETALVGAGDSADIADISALTVNASGASTMSAEAVTTNVLTLNSNLQPAICAMFPMSSQRQLLNGAWAAQVAKQAATQLKNTIDDSLCRDYLAESLCWTTGTASTYHVNTAGDALTEDDFADAIATLMEVDGTQYQNLAIVLSMRGLGSLKSISGYNQSQNTAPKGVLGIPYVGTVDGVPVYATNSIRRNKSVATSAVSVTSNVATATVGAHGFVAGMRITNSGLTNSATNTSAVTITSTTATTVVFPFTAADGDQADGVGTLSDATSWNLVLDTSGIHKSLQIMPLVRLVPDPTTTGTVLQIGALWGRIGRAGKCVVMHSPGSSAA